MVVYNCGNWDYEDKDECPLCGSEPLDEQPGPHNTVSVTCPGWYDDVRKNND